MGSEKLPRLHLAALLYLSIPLFLFFVGWCTWIVAVPVTGCLVFLLGKTTKQISFWSLFNKSQICEIISTGVAAFAWTATSGVWNLGFGRTQDWDVMRNDLLSTLTTYSWPVTHTFADTSTIWSMRHYLGFYLPGPFIGKTFDGNVDITLFATGLWMFVGVWVVLLLGVRQFRNFNWRKYLSIPIFIAFSGLDAIGSRVQGTLSLRPSSLIHGGHIEWWAERYQFSSNTTLLHWVPQHALPSWIGALLVIDFVRSRKHLYLLPFICISSLLWSPFAAMGIALLTLLLLFSTGSVRDFISHIRSSPMVIVSLVIVGAPLLAFLQSGTSEIPHSLLLAHGSFRHNVKMLFEFITLEFGLLAGLTVLVLRNKLRENIIVCLGLATVLMFVVGAYNDFAMRVSPALLVLLFVNACEALFTTPQQKSQLMAQIAMVCVFAIGAITPLFEFVTRYQTPFTSLAPPCIDSGCSSDLTSIDLRNYNWTESVHFLFRK